MYTNQVVQSVSIGLTTLIASISWSALKYFFFEGTSWLWPVLGFVVLLVCLSIVWLLSNSRLLLLIALFMMIFSFLFVFEFKILYIAVLIIGFLLFWLGSTQALKEKEVRVKIQSSHILEKGLPYVLTAFCLIIATVYYFSPLVLGESYPQVYPIFIENIIKPVTEQAMKVMFGANALLQTTEFETMLFNVLDENISGQLETYKDLLSVGSAVSVFFILKFLSIPLMWLIILISSGIFRGLVMIRAVKIQEQSVLKEVITL